MASHQKDIIAPMMTTPTNFLPTLDGHETWDYQDILLRKKTGIWNMPQISPPYLIHRRLITERGIELNSNISEQCREKGIFMYVDNLIDYESH